MALSKKITDAEKPAIIHEAPENPTAQLGSAGFLRLLRSPAGPVRCGRGRAVLTALRLDNARHHRTTATSKENAAAVSGGILAGRCVQGRRAGTRPTVMLDYAPCFSKPG